MSYSSEQQARIDAYLMKLRRSLGDLPLEDVNEILREIRGHILESAETSGEVTNDRLVEILKDLGRPEDIGPLYQAEAMVSRARSSLSPSLILRTTMRWAMISIRGFAVFLAGLVGYSMSLSLLICAILKPFMTDQVGAWVSPGGFSIGITANTNAYDVMGWWLIPFCLVSAAIALVLTTRTLRWTLRFAIPTTGLLRERG